MINLQLDLQSHKNSVFMRGVPVPATKERPEIDTILGLFSIQVVRKGLRNPRNQTKTLDLIQSRVLFFVSIPRKTA